MSESGAAAPARGASTRVDLTKAQKVIARRMAASRSSVPDFVLRTSVDMEGAVALRAAMKSAAASGEQIPSLNDLIVKATALALREQPYANGSYGEEGFELHERVNVGVAMAAPGILVVPVVHDADVKSLAEIAAETHELAALVRSGRIAPPQTSGGTFTVSNLGMYGIEDFDAVVNPPQAAILSVGKVMPVPVASDDGIEVQRRARLGLSCDHRILYGADAAGFLARLGELIERPTWAGGPDESVNTGTE